MNEQKFDQLVAAARQALTDMHWSANNRYRSASAEVHNEGGSLFVCKMAEQKVRYDQVTTSTQFKVDGKVTSRATVVRLLGGARAEEHINEALRAEFEKQAPALADSYAAYVKSVFEEEVQARGPSLKVKTWEASRRRIQDVLIPVCNEILNDRKSEVVAYSLCAIKLRKVADDYGYKASLDWFTKTNSKLGALESPKLLAQHNCHIQVTGLCLGKPVEMLQHPVLKVSSKGLPFFQFPARIYVEGKFTPEKAYREFIARR